jgi:hypothetical protein
LEEIPNVGHFEGHDAIVRKRVFSELVLKELEEAQNAHRSSGEK